MRLQKVMEGQIQDLKESRNPIGNPRNLWHNLGRIPRIIEKFRGSSVNLGISYAILRSDLPLEFYCNSYAQKSLMKMNSDNA